MRQENEHTPGPWKFINSRDWIYINAHGNIAKIPNSDYCVENDLTDKTALSNAKLISAAPDLLHACKIALDCLIYTEISSHIQEVLKAAINKATK